MSDKGARGEREDASGAAIREMLAGIAEIIRYEVIPDERELIAKRLKSFSDELGADLVVTTGGTS